LRSLQHREGKDEMTKASIDLQDLRRRIYVKAKAEPSWRFWGLYVHVCKMETLREAYEMAKKNDGAPGVDGVTFEAIEAQGVEALLEQLRDELIRRTYQPLPARRQEIPKDGGSSRQGWKSDRVEVPVPSITWFGRLAYPVRVEVTKHDRPGCKSPGCPAAVFAAVGTIWGVSKLGGRNIKEYLQPRDSAHEKSLFVGHTREADPSLSGEGR
jgi:hypothetical protein